MKASLREIKAIKEQMWKARDETMRLAFMLEKWPDRAGELFGTAKLLIDWQEGIENNCDHEWGTDGCHSNEYCKKCFISK
jgi:hypothetical protein